LSNIPRTLRTQRVVNPAASASAVLTINNSSDCEFSGLLGGSGGSLGAGTVAGNNFSLVKSGSGTFTLSRSGGNGYTNGTSINGGTLLVSNATASATTGATGPGPININSGGTFAGAGIINSATTNNAGGTLSPGGTIGGAYGTLTFSNNVVMQAGSTSIFEVDGSTPQNDQIILGSASGIVTYGGVLKIVPSGGFTIGQTFTLFSGALASSASNFGSIVGSPGSGKAFSFTNGVLSVVSAPSAPSPVTLTNSLSGSVLGLSWPAGQGWRLQAQTNALSTGLSTNWADVTSSAVSSTNITVDSTKPTVFYRLVYP
jgi:autotransporter-associated beta strand protein